MTDNVVKHYLSVCLLDLFSSQTPSYVFDQTDFISLDMTNMYHLKVILFATVLKITAQKSDVLCIVVRVMMHYISIIVVLSKACDGYDISLYI